MQKLVHVRLPQRLITEIQKNIDDGNFVSVSDFIREAIRDYLERQEKRKILEKLVEKKGSWKRLGRPSEEDLERIRENILDYF